MGTSILFIPLHPNPGETACVSLSEFRSAFEKFGIPVDDFGEGSHLFDFCTPEGAPFTLHEQAGVSIKREGVASFRIHRPCSPASHELWFALLEIGFVMIPDNCQVFATASMASKVGYLHDRSLFPMGVTVVSTPEDFPW